jgi:hypothetical protein
MYLSKISDRLFDQRWSRCWQRFLRCGWKQKHGLWKKSCYRERPASYVQSKRQFAFKKANHEGAEALSEEPPVGLVQQQTSASV